MDVRCERCKTEYEFDDARITEAGVTVKCTTCSHVFKVKKKALVVTVPVKPGELEQASLAADPAAASAPERNREWRVRQASGNLFTFKELTTLQKWIVERKVARDDEISLTGESWKRLGNIAELASFFQVVDEAQKSHQLQALQQQLSQPLPQVPAGPPAIAAATPPAPMPAPTPAPVAPEPVVTPPESSGEPRFIADKNAVRSAARRTSTSDELDLAAAGIKRKGGAGKWVLLLLLLGALGGGAWAHQNGLLEPYTRTLFPPAPVDPVPVPAPSEPQHAEVPEPAPEPVPEPEAVVTPEPAPVPEPVAAVVPEPAPAPEPVKKPEPVEKPDTVPAVAAAPKLSFDQLMSQADRQRMRDRPEQALTLYAKAIELKPDRAEPVAGRGLALLDLGQRGPAEAAFREALKLNPRYAVAVMGLAETYRQQGRRADALAQYQKYLDILPNGPDARAARSAIERLKE